MTCTLCILYAIDLDTRGEGGVHCATAPACVLRGSRYSIPSGQPFLWCRCWCRVQCIAETASEVLTLIQGATPAISCYSCRALGSWSTCDLECSLNFEASPHFSGPTQQEAWSNFHFHRGAQHGHERACRAQKVHSYTHCHALARGSTTGNQWYQPRRRNPASEPSNHGASASATVHRRWILVLVGCSSFLRLASSCSSLTPSPLTPHPSVSPLSLGALSHKPHHPRAGKAAHSPGRVT